MTGRDAGPIAKEEEKSVEGVERQGRKEVTSVGSPPTPSLLYGISSFSRQSSKVQTRVVKLNENDFATSFLFTILPRWPSSVERASLSSSSRPRSKPRYSGWSGGATHGLVTKGTLESSRKTREMIETVRVREEVWAWS